MSTVINYLEFKSHNLEATKEFYQKCFDWKFTDYGPTYSAFSNSGVEGGFELTEQPITNGALVILHHENLPAIKKAITTNGGSVSVDTFPFPGGERFQFTDPSGNELSVWCEKD